MSKMKKTERGRHMPAKRVSVKKASVKKAVRLLTEKPEKPKQLSKLGEWMQAHPNGIGLIIHDMRAVMK
jgi:hypothetical protein